MTDITKKKGGGNQKKILHETSEKWERREGRKPKDLSTREREECGNGEGGGVYTVCMFFSVVKKTHELVCM